MLWLEDPENPGRFTPDARLGLSALASAVGQFLAARRAHVAPPRPQQPLQPVRGIVAGAESMRPTLAAIHAFAPMPWPALILGETGTGKEAIAHALHHLSARADEAFLALNCGAIVEGLAESTLFGHERGAFTGAARRQAGIVERVGAGTLFLDEVSELSPALQVKLLRLLQEGVFERVGGDQVLRFAGRIVAATHRPLDRPDQRQGFRDDLYFRLAACIIRVPPLRERREDIPALATHLLERATRELQLAAPPALSAEALDDLKDRAWPGNVRQLENVLRAAVDT
ncbi:MAG: sigma-54-dependent Fis family transcriptional regulator, partial [Oligoflexia bacterium]|nr:sigma-54-dependent Fis family transcriptional regulator [Oligoflexia bacterium]